MHKLIILAAASSAIALSGCQSVLKDLQGCERHYDGTVSGGAIQPAVLAGHAKIDCCPASTVANTDHTNCIPIPLAGLSVGDQAGATSPTK